jgi:ribosome assembly protein YihI (activator of Der GTPase)
LATGLGTIHLESNLSKEGDCKMDPKNTELEIIELDERLDMTIDPLAANMTASILGHDYCGNIDCCHKVS